MDHLRATGPALAVAFGLLATVNPGGAGAPDPNVVSESWETAHLDGAKIGFVHSHVHPVGAPSARRLRATEELDFTFRRRNVLVQVRMEHGTEETVDGRVVAVFMRQFHGRGQQLSLTGELEDGRMHVIVDKGRIERRLRWSPEILGLHGQERLFREKKLRVGDELSFPAYEPTINAVVTRRVKAVRSEQVAGIGNRSLLRVEVTPDRLTVPGASVQLPKSILWLDEDGIIRRRQIEVDGLGEIMLTRATRELARAAGATVASTPDISLKTLVSLDRAVPRAFSQASAVYRITLRGETEFAGVLAQDAHQEIRAARGESLELVVHPLREPRGRGNARPGPEFLASCYFIDRDDDRIKELARQAVGTETDAWRAALRIERWVNRNMQPDNAAPMAPASQIARSLRGDCRQYALLTAALCRATGIPARTAVGLVQVERGGRSYLGFHLWTEVCVEGHWRGLDATLGMGGVGVGHVKIADHNWEDVRSLTPFLPVQRLLGKISVTVLEP